MVRLHGEVHGRVISHDKDVPLEHAGGGSDFEGSSVGPQLPHPGDVAWEAIYHGRDAQVFRSIRVAINDDEMLEMIKISFHVVHDLLAELVVMLGWHP